MINGRLFKNDMGGVLSVHSHGETKENNGKLCSVPRAIFDRGTSRLRECKREPTCLDPNNYKNEIRTSVYQFREKCTRKCLCCLGHFYDCYLYFITCECKKTLTQMTGFHRTELV
jgi:hypothetical protein